MKYLLTVMTICMISCKKDDAPVKPKPEPPSIIKVSTATPFLQVVASPQKNDTFYRPRFEVTLNVPDSSAVTKLSIYVKSLFPYYTPVEILNPKSGVYTVVDMNNIYPAIDSKKTYFSVFTMKDFSYITNASFDSN
jgi:hypothetical protein